MKKLFVNELNRAQGVNQCFKNQINQDISTLKCNFNTEM